MHQDLLNDALAHGRRYLHEGNVASYIPELKKTDPELLGVCVITTDGACFEAGDSGVLFSLQSVCKVLTLLYAIETVGEPAVFARVGMEPTGDSFNSIVRLEDMLAAKPFNPLINAGAIAVASILPGASEEDRFQRVLAYARRLLGNPALAYSESIFRSEKETGHKNRALGYMMKNSGILEGDVEAHLDLYFKLCSLMATCRDMAQLAAILANDGCDPKTGEKLVSRRALRITRSLMATCGMYNYSGEFATRVGLPSKSGVGGGILSVVPRMMGIGVFGPALDKRGNSVGGVRVLEYLSDRLDLSIF